MADESARLGLERCEEEEAEQDWTAPVEPKNDDVGLETYRFSFTSATDRGLQVRRNAWMLTSLNSSADEVELLLWTV